MIVQMDNMNLSLKVGEDVDHDYSAPRENTTNYDLSIQTNTVLEHGEM